MSIETEADLWKNVLKGPLNDYGFFERSENSSGTGMSDVSYTVPGHTGFIELKIAHGTLENPYVTLQRTQIPWNKVRSSYAAGDYWFLVYFDLPEYLMLIQAHRLLQMPNEPVGERHNKFFLVPGLILQTYPRKQINFEVIIHLLQITGHALS